MAKPSMGARAPGFIENSVGGGERRSRDGGPAAEFIAGLPAMVDGLAPDARLLEACEEFLTLEDQQAADSPISYDSLGGFHCVRNGRWHGARTALAGIRAQTVLGRREKAEAALKTLPYCYELALVRAALEDCLAGLDEGMGGRT